jgi:hypothetical protein
LRKKEGGGNGELLEEGGFAAYLARKLYKTDYLPLDESKKASQAVLGMMRFANYDNPLLLEALGDLLSYTRDIRAAARQLATRAYLAASYKFKGQPQEAVYRSLARGALSMQTTGPNSSDQLGLPELEYQFAAERKNADIWYQNLKAKELDWISKDANVDAEFDKLYRTEPKLLTEGTALRDWMWTQGLWIALISSCFLILVVFAVHHLLRKLSKRNNTSA